MKILYGVQGTGNGHLSRARIMANAFNRYEQLDVHYLFSGREVDQYKDMDMFPNAQFYKGLSFTTKNGRLDYSRSFKEMSFKQFLRDLKSLDLSSFDLVISDYEPLSAWAANKQNVPSVGIGNQYAYHWNIPKKIGHRLLSWLLKNFAPVDTPLGNHWHAYDSPILPPIQQIGAGNIEQAEHFLIYLPFEDQGKVLEILNELAQYQFHLFGSKLSAQQIGNVKVCGFGRSDFLQSLESCRGVFCNAGFELPSEALALGKSLMVKPTHGQIEQTNNALALKQLGYAKTCKKLSKKKVIQWIEENQSTHMRLPDVASNIVEWIMDETKPQVSLLSQKLWSQVIITKT